MPIPTPFHPRTSKLCTSYRWKDWAGYYAVCSFENHHDREYQAFRHSAGLIDVSPLYKYEVYGPDAADFLSRVMVRNIKRLRMNRVVYTCWCDQKGKVVDDGTVARLKEDHYRVTSALPMYAWFHRFTRGYRVTIEDSSTELAALSLQGPTSRDILKQICDANLDTLRFFGLTQCKLDDLDITLTRTGYTGDLGYEIWVQKDKAIPLWDALMDAGKAYRIEPAGLDAMDVARIEAGFVLNGVDYFSAPSCLTEFQSSTPTDAGLDWTVGLKNRGEFNGKSAIIAEKERGPTWGMVGLVLDWDEYEALYRARGLPPEVPHGAWRTAVPIYNEFMEFIGQATSGTWSPTLKKNLALATLYTKYTPIGTKVQMEVTVEYERKTVTATVTPRPFFDPVRKKS